MSAALAHVAAIVKLMTVLPPTSHSAPWLKAEGLSLNVMAARMNDQDVLTSRGHCWWPDSYSSAPRVARLASCISSRGLSSIHQHCFVSAEHRR